MDDNAHVILDYAGGTKGVLLATQVAPGYENEIRLRVSGTKGSIEWSQSSSNYLRYSPLGAAPQTMTRGGPVAGEAAMAVSRIPGGHPEGYLEAFATIYSEAATLIRGGEAPLLPTVQDGVDGVKFLKHVWRHRRRMGPGGRCRCTSGWIWEALGFGRC